MTLVEQLNKYEVSYESGPDGVSLQACPQDDSLFDKDGNVTDPAFNTFLEKLDAFKAYVADNPRDRRCGLVVFVEHDGELAWYDQNGDCAWVEG